MDRLPARREAGQLWENALFARSLLALWKNATQTPANNRVACLRHAVTQTEVLRQLGLPCWARYSTCSRNMPRDRRVRMIQTASRVGGGTAVLRAGRATAGHRVLLAWHIVSAPRAPRQGAAVAVVRARVRATSRRRRRWRCWRAGGRPRSPGGVVALAVGVGQPERVRALKY